MSKAAALLKEALLKQPSLLYQVCATVLPYTRHVLVCVLTGCPTAIPNQAKDVVPCNSSKRGEHCTALCKPGYERESGDDSEGNFECTEHTPHDEWEPSNPDSPLHCKAKVCQGPPGAHMNAVTCKGWRYGDGTCEAARGEGDLSPPASLRPRHAGRGATHTAAASR